MAALEDVIEEFAARRAIRPPAPDAATGAYALAIDGRYLVHFLELDGVVAAWAWLGDLPGAEHARESLLRRLLRAELGRLGADDAVLSVDEAAGALHLHHVVARAAFDLSRLESLLQSLVDNVERRRGMLGQGPTTRPIAPLVIRP